MTDSLTAYDLAAVKKKLSLAKIKTWHKGGLINTEQWTAIQNHYESSLFSPSIFIRILLFIATYFGLMTIIGPLILIVGDAGETTIRVMLLISGVLMLIFVEKMLIKEKHHFKSGVTEAGSYTGLLFIYSGVVGFGINLPLVYFGIAFIFLAISTIRYLDLLSLVALITCFLAILFLSFEPIMWLLPFIVMITFIGLFLCSQSLQKRVDSLIWEDHFIIFDTLALLLIYLGGNYFVVRELSVEMMNLILEDGQDIPFAFIFYGFTLLIPVAYLTWGIMRKSILFIRVSLLVLALSVITIKYYYSLGHPELTITISGGLLIVISLALIKYLKKSRRGFVRDQIFKSKWDNTDLAAFVASQTLGGHQINESEGDFTGQGGEFGGGGASGSY